MTSPDRWAISIDRYCVGSVTADDDACESLSRPVTRGVDANVEVVRILREIRAQKRRDEAIVLPFKGRKSTHNARVQVAIRKNLALWTAPVRKVTVFATSCLAFPAKRCSLLHIPPASQIQMEKHMLTRSTARKFLLLCVLCVLCVMYLMAIAPVHAIASPTLSLVTEQRYFRAVTNVCLGSNIQSQDQASYANRETDWTRTRTAASAIGSSRVTASAFQRSLIEPTRISGFGVKDRASAQRSVSQGMLPEGSEQ